MLCQFSSRKSTGSHTSAPTSSRSSRRRRLITVKMAQESGYGDGVILWQQRHFRSRCNNVTLKLYSYPRGTVCVRDGPPVPRPVGGLQAPAEKPAAAAPPRVLRRRRTSGRCRLLAANGHPPYPGSSVPPRPPVTAYRNARVNTDVSHGVCAAFRDFVVPRLSAPAWGPLGDIAVLWWWWWVQAAAGVSAPGAPPLDPGRAVVLMLPGWLSEDTRANEQYDLWGNNTLYKCPLSLVSYKHCVQVLYLSTHLRYLTWVFLLSIIFLLSVTSYFADLNEYNQYINYIISIRLHWTPRGNSQATHQYVK